MGEATSVPTEGKINLPRASPKSVDIAPVEQADGGQPQVLASRAHAAKSPAVLLLLVLAVLASITWFAVGFAVQDWDSSSTTTTGGKSDKTWGTWATDYTLGVECWLMALCAPGSKGSLFKLVVAASFAVEGLSWVGGGVLHHFYYEPGTAHDYIWTICLITGGLAAISRVLASQLAALAFGKCRCCCCSSPRVVTLIFIGLMCIGATAVVLAVLEHIPVKDWMVAVLKSGISGICVIVYGFVLGAPKRAAAVLVAFCATLALNQIKFAPFKYSEDFNDNGLFHSAMMLYLAAVFFLFHFFGAPPAAKQAEFGSGTATSGVQDTGTNDVFIQVTV